MRIRNIVLLKIASRFCRIAKIYFCQVGRGSLSPILLISDIYFIRYKASHWPSSGFGLNARAARSPVTPAKPSPVTAS